MKYMFLLILFFVMCAPILGANRSNNHLGQYKYSPYGHHYNTYGHHYNPHHYNGHHYYNHHGYHHYYVQPRFYYYGYGGIYFYIR